MAAQSASRQAERSLNWSNLDAAGLRIANMGLVTPAPTGRLQAASTPCALGRGGPHRRGSDHRIHEINAQWSSSPPNARFDLRSGHQGGARRSGPYRATSPSRPVCHFESCSRPSRDGDGSLSARPRPSLKHSDARSMSWCKLPSQRTSSRARGVNLGVLTTLNAGGQAAGAAAAFLAPAEDRLEPPQPRAHT